MRLFPALRSDGTSVQYPAYTIDDFPLENVSRETFQKRVKEDRITYSNSICTFDIETTSYRTVDGVSGFMYIWQFCIDGVCIYGRHWSEFSTLLRMLREYTDAKLIIYVHNLSFEFQFIRQLLLHMYGEIEVFATQKRKPLTVRTSDVELRCSYKLSNMTLAKACQNEIGCEYHKAVGDLDYSVYRTCDSNLNDLEFGYCMSDVLCLYSYIKAKLANDHDTLKTIPLTSTGYVRRDCRKACKASDSYQKLYSRMTISEAVYKLLKEAGRGGDTSSNRFLTGEMISNVDSFDVKSSYPYQMLTQEYPMSRFYSYGKVEDLDEFIALHQEHALLFRVTFEGLEALPDTVDLYLTVDKANASAGKVVNCNGRVFSAAYINYTLTEMDWKIVETSYTWKSISVSDMHYAKKALLPEELRAVILSYFRSKCELGFKRDKYDEDSPEYANLNYLYAKSKNKLNGIFGMTYTDIVRNIITIDEGGIWYEKLPDKISDAIDDYYNNRNNFLYYAWGIWTTAYARVHLHHLIRLIGETSIYWDTDSDKAQVTPEILANIKEANKEIQNICDRTGAYVDMPYGREYLGIYEHETSNGAYRRFKTLGAKKYAYEDYRGHLHVTVSGVNKSKGASELGDLENFVPGFIFREAGGITLYYNRAPWRKETHNGASFYTGDNIGITDSTYMLGVTKEYAEILCLDMYVKDGKVHRLDKNHDS